MTSPMPFEPRAGQLLSFLAEDGLFGALKLLAVDERGVHVRIYVQRFPTRPTEADLGELSLSTFLIDQQGPLSVGHMPLSYATFFSGWAPEPICQRDVEPNELKGYQHWLDADAGYF